MYMEILNFKKLYLKLYIANKANVKLKLLLD